MAPSSPAKYAPPAMARAARCGWALKESSTNTTSSAVSQHNCSSLTPHTTPSLADTSPNILPSHITHITLYSYTHPHSTHRSPFTTALATQLTPRPFHTSYLSSFLHNSSLIPLTHLIPHPSHTHYPLTLTIPTHPHHPNSPFNFTVNSCIYEEGGYKVEQKQQRRR